MKLLGGMVMATNTPKKPAGMKENPGALVMHTIGRETKPLRAFWLKFNNDWSWNNAAGLAYNLLMSMFPIVIAFLAIIGLLLGRLDPAGYDKVIKQITYIFPGATSSQNILKLALHQLTKNSGILGIFAIVVAIFYGSRLFVFMEGCFDIIYHVRPRGVIAQNALAILMLLLFVILIPIMVLASLAPAFAVSILQKTPLNEIPGSSILFSPSGILGISLSGILGGLIAAYILFQVIYMVVPNQKISFRKSWPGALVAAVLLEMYLTLFPLYMSYFLGIFAGALGLLILLIFFYYFALILFLGAEVNAFFAQGVRETPYDLATMVHLVTSHLATSEEAVKEQASADHKDEEPKEIRPQHKQAS
jgi:membrane protein